MPLPIVSADQTKTIVARKSFIRLTPSGGSQAEYMPKNVSLNTAFNSIDRKSVINGMLQTDRSVPVEKNISFTLTFDEFIQGLMDLVLSGIPKTGVAQIFITDPDDANGKAALMTNSFSCRFELDGNVDFSRENFSEYSIRVIALSDVTFTVDGTA